MAFFTSYSHSVSYAPALNYLIKRSYIANLFADALISDLDFTLVKYADTGVSLSSTNFATVCYGTAYLHITQSTSDSMYMALYWSNSSTSYSGYSGGVTYYCPQSNFNSGSALYSGFTLALTKWNVKSGVYATWRPGANTTFEECIIVMTGKLLFDNSDKIVCGHRLKPVTGRAWVIPGELIGITSPYELTSISAVNDISGSNYILVRGFFPSASAQIVLTSVFQIYADSAKGTGVVQIADRYFYVGPDSGASYCFELNS